MTGNETHCDLSDPKIIGPIREYIFSAFHIGLVVVVYTYLTCFTLVTNALSIFIFTRPYMQIGLTMFLTCLSLSDALYAAALWLSKVLEGINMWTEGAIDSQVVANAVVQSYPWMKIFYTYSAWLVIITSVERFIAICYPFSTTILKSTRKALLVCAVVYLVAVLANIPAFIEFEVVKQQSNNVTLYRVHAGAAQDEIAVYTTIMRTVTHFAGPLVVILVINTLILREVRKIKKFRDTMNHHRKRDLKNGTMFIIYTFMFMICHFLPTCLYLMETIGGKANMHCHGRAFLIASDMSHLLLLLNSCFSIFVYYFYGSKYREAIHREFCGKQADLADGVSGSARRLSQKSIRYKGYGSRRMSSQLSQRKSRQSPALVRATVDNHAGHVFDCT